MPKTKIVGMVVQDTTLTVFTEDGKQHRIPAANVGSVDVLLEMSEDIKTKGYTEIDLAQSIKDADEFYIFQANSKVVQFYRVAKDFVGTLFGKDTSAPDPKPVKRGSEETQHKKESKRAHRKSINLIDQAQEQAKSLPEEETTTVAVVDKQTVLPNADKMKVQVTHANQTGNRKGVEAFMQRMAKMIHKRNHSVDDLLAFIKKADLPLTDSGDIVAYKRVNKKSDGVFVDVHSGRVTQWKGARVFMAESLVDSNRKQECSNGLHVARRQYLSGFSGNHTLYLVVRPEDVIAVPHGDTNKVRVCGYTVVGVADPNAHSLLASSQSIKGTSAEKAIAHIVAGNLPTITHDIEITQQSGQGLVVTERKSEPVKEQPKAEIQKEAVIDDTTVKTGKRTPKKVDVKKIGNASSAASQKAQMLAKIPPKNKADAQAVLAWKRRQKKSWAKLGISDADGKAVESKAK